MPDKKLFFYEKIKAAKEQFHNVVNFDGNRDKLVSLDCTVNNQELAKVDLTDTVAFSAYIQQVRETNQATYLIGGYNENRTLYTRSPLFGKPTVKDSNTDYHSSETTGRSLHLGTDIWGDTGTPLFAPLGGRVHSFAFNDHFGDYGATIILMHQMDGLLFYTLYGHLSLKDLGNLNEGKFLNRGERIGHFGPFDENGNWPPHLHFQIILDMKNFAGDYPGVCRPDQSIEFLQNSPDPDIILNLNRFLSGS